MKKHIYYIVTTLVFLLMSFTYNKPAYLIYKKGGKRLQYSNMLSKLAEADVILFGELHNNPICHWLQLEVTKDLYAEKENQLALGAEMFETDDQLIMDEYLEGKIQRRHLESEAKVWDNYDTDYAPLVQFAKAHQLPFVASNVPRRYASLVSREGLSSLDSLSEEAIRYMAPLPIEVDMELPGYQKMLGMMGGHSMKGNAEYFVHAQAIKDATMAYFISKAMEEKGSKALIHFNGSYHSNNFEGIFWYLQQYAPELNVLTIASVEQQDISKLEPQNKVLADFILCIPSEMTKTYISRF